MRVLVAGPRHLVSALIAAGHDAVDVFEERGTCTGGVPFDIAARWAADRERADVVLVADMIGPQAMPYGLERVPVPRLYWAIDVHLNFFWQRHYAQCFDLVLSAQRDWTAAFVADGVPARWLPWGTDTRIFRDRGGPRPHDVAFVGCVDPLRRPKRSAVLAALRERFDVVVRGDTPEGRLTWEDTAALYGAAKLVVNESIFGDVTFRVFEAMGAGALLVTEDVDNGLRDLFMPGVHCAVFHPDDLVETVAHWLADDAGRARVAAAGAAAVAAGHDLRHRMAELMALVAAGIPRRPDPRPPRRHWAVAAHLAMVRGLLVPGAALRLVVDALDRAFRWDGDVDAALALAEVAGMSGASQHAEAIAAAACHAAPADPRTWLLASELRRLAGDAAGAAAMQRTGLHHAPLPAAEREAALRDLAVPGEAALAVGSVLEACGHAFVPGLIGVRGLHVARTAFDLYIRAVDEQPDAAAAAARVAAIFEYVGLADLALDYRRRVVAWRRADPAAREALAATLAATYDARAAAHQRRVACALRGEPPAGTPAERAAALHEVGVARHDGGDVAGAVTALDAAVALSPGTASYETDAALAHVAANDWAAAEALLTAALGHATADRAQVVELLALVRMSAARAAHHPA